MNPLILYQNTQLELQETKNTLALRGISLSKENILSLQQTILFICKKLHWIETDHSKLNQILAPFLNSPYMSTNNYLDTLKNLIISYYEVRSRYHRFVEDTMILDAMEMIYIKRGGTLDIYYVEKVLHQVQRMRGTK